MCIRRSCKVVRSCGFVLILTVMLAGCSAIRNSGILNTGEVQFGMASWYGGEFHGRMTTCGEEYDMYKISAAHRTLPFGTFVRVRNLENDKTLIVRINDRGPWVPGRVIDLSYGAAQKLGIIARGTARVRLDIIDKQIGVAAWYGGEFHGRATASGEIYDMNQLTAAHSLLPFGTRVRVTNIENNQTVIVRINDRMPLSEERVINLSRRAGEKLDILKRGTATVVLDVIKSEAST